MNMEEDQQRQGLSIGTIFFGRVDTNDDAVFRAAQLRPENLIERYRQDIARVIITSTPRVVVTTLSIDPARPYGLS